VNYRREIDRLEETQLAIRRQHAQLIRRVSELEKRQQAVEQAILELSAGVSSFLPSGPGATPSEPGDTIQP
jgi:chromosome segregation ATPase